MESELIKIEKLEESKDWTTWKFLVQILLKSNDVFDVVSGDDEKPATAGDDLTAWKKKEYKAQRIITGTLAKKVVLHVQNCKTSKEMWDKLNLVFESRGETSKHLLQERFFAFKKDPNDDIATHIAKLIEIVAQLKHLSVAIDDSMVITKVLMTLPTDFRHFSSAWESTAKNDQTLENLQSRLINEEHRLNATSEESNTTAAMFTKTAKYGKSHGKNKKKGKCFKCGSDSHWKRDCTAKTQTHLASNDEQKQSESFSFYANDYAMVCEVQKENDDESFIFDSAATSHMCYKREWFGDFVEYKTPKSVLVGNKQIILAHGHGNIAIKSFNGKTWIDATIYDVLYVPDVCRNLFSFNAAAKKGCEIKANRNEIKLLKGESSIAVGENRNGLFYMKFQVKRFVERLKQKQTKPEKQRDYAIVEISNERVDESSKLMQPNDQVVGKETKHISGDIVDDSSQNMQANVQVVEQRANEIENESNSVNANIEKEGDGKTATVNKKKNAKSKSGKQQSKPEKVKDRRPSKLCDVTKQNIVDTRLRRPSTLDEGQPDSNSDLLHERNTDDDDEEDKSGYQLFSDL